MGRISLSLVLATRWFAVPAGPRAWGAGTRVLVLAAAFAALSGGLRLGLTTDHPPDDAELMVAARTLRGGYNDQPPLFTWVLWGVTQLTGPGVAGLALMRGVLLVALVGVTYATARLFVPDRRLHAPVACSSLLFPMYAWHAATYFTHTLLLGVAVMATLYAVARVVRDGRTRDYLTLGGAVTLGVYAKYNFAFVVLAAAAAGLTLPEARRRLLDRRLLLSAGVAGLLLLPHLVWLAEWSDEIVRMLRLKADRDERPPYWAGVVRGLKAGVTSLIPCVALVVPACVLAARGAYRLRPADPVVSWLGRFLLALALVHVGLVFACGVTRFADRWLQPLLLPLPLWYFARLAPDTVRPGRLLWMTGASALMAVTIVGAQVGQIVCVGGLRAAYDMRLDYRTLAREFEGAGFGDATLVGWDRELLGNLQVHLPGATTIHSTGANTLGRPAGRVVVVWNEGKWGATPPWGLTPQFAPAASHAPPNPDAVRRFTLRPRPPCRHPIAVAACELPPG